MGQCDTLQVFWRYIIGFGEKKQDKFIVLLTENHDHQTINYNIPQEKHTGWERYYNKQKCDQTHSTYSFFRDKYTNCCVFHTTRHHINS